MLPQVFFVFNKKKSFDCDFIIETLEERDNDLIIILINKRLSLFRVFM
jgi:hypothetical protein